MHRPKTQLWSAHSGSGRPLTITCATIAKTSHRFRCGGDFGSTLLPPVASEGDTLLFGNIEICFEELGSRQSSTIDIGRPCASDVR